MEMDDAISDFDQRVREIENFFRTLRDINAEGATLSKVVRGKSSAIPLNNEFLETLKATCFLLLYNLVESSIRSGFTALYQSINRDSKTLDELRSEFKQVWVDQLFYDMEAISANQQTYRSLASDMVGLLTTKSVVALDPKKLKLSGNLDANQIRQILKKHSVAIHSHPRAFGGGELSTVKDQRNALAHGNLSFTECGQNYTIEDLARIKKRTVIYVRGTLRNIRNYLDKKSYAA